MANAPQQERLALPLWALIIILVLFFVFTINSIFSAHMELRRRSRDEWMRAQILDQQDVQNQRLADIRAQVEQSLSTLNVTLDKLAETQTKIEETKKTVVETIKSQEEHGVPRGVHPFP